MKEMEAEGDHRNDVEQRDPPDAEARHHVRVYILTAEGTGRPYGASREMQDVDDYEHEEENAAPAHRARRDRRCLRLPPHVAERPRGAALAGELSGRDHVQDDGDDQNDAQPPQQLARTFEKMRIGVDRIRSAEDEQIAERMEDDEADADETGDFHDGFLADHGAVELAKPAHQQVTALPRPSARALHQRSSPGHRAPLG